MAKFQNRGLVILYQGMPLTGDVEEAVLHTIAPFVHSGAKADIFQLNAIDLAKAATGTVVLPALSPTVETKTPETEAAKLIGITFKDALRAKNPVLLTMRLLETIQKCTDNPSDESVAMLRALKIVAKPEFFISVDSKELEKYYLSITMLDVIRKVLTLKGIPYE